MAIWCSMLFDSKARAAFWFVDLPSGCHLA
jgi:hypothetical protein